MVKHWRLSYTRPSLPAPMSQIRNIKAQRQSLGPCVPPTRAHLVRTTQKLTAIIQEIQAKGARKF
jgi:hypothetical protein